MFGSSYVDSDFMTHRSQTQSHESVSICAATFCLAKGLLQTSRRERFASSARTGKL